MSGQQENQSPGGVIAAARRARGLSVEDLAERTKIPAAMLAAIEADEFHRLSGPLYARSFLRSCAKELGLAPEDVLDLYTRQAGEPLRVLHEAPGVPEAVRIRRVGLPWGRLAGGGGAVLAVAVVALLLTRGGGDAPPTGTDLATSRAANGMLAAGAGGAAADEGTAVPGTVVTREDAMPAATSAAADAGADSLPGGATEGSVPVAPVRRDGPAPAGVPGLAFADGRSWPVVVRLTTAYPISARARRDGDAEYSGVTWTDSLGVTAVPAEGVVAGRAYAAGAGLVVYWGAVDRVSLLLGSTDGVEVTVNGRPQVLRVPGSGDELRLELRAAAPKLP